MAKPVEHILLLGGTGMALQLARALLAQGQQLTYSIAGLVRQPDLSCNVISGGFTQFGGMTQFVREQQITLIIDATHPYAAQISQHAAVAAQACALPCWRLQRLPWEAAAGDRWSEFADWESLLPALRNHEQVFLSQGRLSEEQLAQLTAHKQPGQQFYLRTAMKSELDLPDWIEPLRAIGPFDYADELALLRRLRIDVLVSKNSGGEMTVAKLRAARELGVSVLFLRRPVLPQVGRVFLGVESLLNELTAYCK